MSDIFVDRILNAVLTIALLLFAVFLAQPGVIFGAGPSVVIGPTGQLSVIVPPPSTGSTTIISPSGNLTHIVPSPTPGGIGVIIDSSGNLGFVLPSPPAVPLPIPATVNPW